MKKLLLLFLLSFIVIFSFAQTTFPTYQPVGNSVTLWDQKGAVRGTKGLIVGNYTDTTAANGAGNYIKFYSGAQIFTTSDDQIWVRDATATRWINVTTGFSPTPACGLQSGTGIVHYDSLLIFSVTAANYSLCCDNIPRTTLADSIKLPAADPSNPVWVAIILDATGVNYVRGVPAANPSLPQLTDCQIALTYVLINAGDIVPANVSVTTIYDENYTSEWDSVTTSTLVMDTANTTFPVHLLKDIDVTSYGTGGWMEFRTATTVDLNNYGILKFYVRLKGVATIRFSLTWYLDGVQQTFSAVPLVISGITGVYQVMAVPISAFRILNNSSVNKLRIQVFGTQGFYLDWIQLQAGIIPSSPIDNGFTTLNVGNLDSLFNSFVTFPIGQPVVNYTKQNVPAYTALVNPNNTTGPFVWNKINLATPIITGLLPVTNIAPGGANYVLTTVGGVATWVASTPGYDTTFVVNGLHVIPGVTSDTLSLGGSLRENVTIATVASTLTISTATSTVNPLAVTATTGIAALITGSNANSAEGVLFVNNTDAGSSNAIYAQSAGTNAAVYGKGSSGGNGVIGEGNTGVVGIGAGGNGVLGTATSGTGVTGTTVTGTTAGSFSTNPASTTTIVEILDLSRKTSGTAGNGIGGNITFKTETASGTNRLTNELISKLSDATDATRTSQFIITGVNSATTQNLLSLAGSGQLTLDQYTTSNFNGGVAADSVLVITSTGIVKKRDAASFGGGGGGSPPINTLLAATGTNTINNANFGQEWQWNTLAATTALGLTSTSTAATGNSQVLFSSSLSGANATAGQITKAAYIINSHTGATSQNYAGDFRATNGTTNVAGYFSSSGGTNNYGIIVPSGGGNVGIGTSTPTATNKLEIQAIGSDNGTWSQTVDGFGVYGKATGSGLGVEGISVDGIGLRGESTNGISLVSISQNSYAGEFTINNASTNTVERNIALTRNSSSGVGANGIGSSIDFLISTTTNTRLSNQLISKLSDATDATRTSQLIITGVNNAVTGNIAYFNGNGNVGIGAAPTSAQLFVINDGTTDLFYIDKTNFESWIESKNGTTRSLLDLWSGSSPYFDLSVTNGTDVVDITGDADAKTIVLTAGNGIIVGTVQVFADNAAAITGGLAVGTLYRTGDILKIVH